MMTAKLFHVVDIDQEKNRRYDSARNNRTEFQCQKIFNLLKKEVYGERPEPGQPMTKKSVSVF